MAASSNPKFPYPAGLNIANFVSLKLTSSNYLLWETQVLSLIESQDLLGFITGNTPQPAVEIDGDEGKVPNPDFAAWTRTDQLVKGWITANILEEALGNVVGLVTSLDVWKALSNAYSQDSEARECELLLKLQEKKRESTSLADYIRDFKSTCDQLNAIGKPIPDKKKVNNAGIGGATVDWDSVKTLLAAAAAAGGSGSQIKWNELMTQTYESAKPCLQTNYYGAKWMSEALIPLLQLSDSPRIVNVSSGLANFKNLPSECARGVLSDAERLTEERVEEVLNEFMKDFKEGLIETKGWPLSLSAYTVSKLAMNAYTRILAKNYPNFRINSVCPGYVKTDINGNTGVLSVEEGAESIVRLALLPDDGPSGLFFIRNEVWTD